MRYDTLCVKNVARIVWVNEVTDDNRIESVATEICGTSNGK